MYTCEAQEALDQHLLQSHVHASARCLYTSVWVFMYEEKNRDLVPNLYFHRKGTERNVPDGVPEITNFCKCTCKGDNERAVYVQIIVEKQKDIERPSNRN